MHYTVFFLAFLTFKAATALYSSSDDVIDLTPATFSDVKTSDEVWFVEFYSPQCGHCHALVPEWKKAATALKGIVKIAAVDMSKYSELGSPYDIRGFPTIKIFSANKRSPTEYQGARTARAIVTEALKEVEKVVNSRLSGDGSSQGSRQQRSSSGSDVVELTDNNFEELVLKSDEPWLVEFFAPWCGHCKNLKPHWEEAATELRGKVKLGALDATAYTTIAGRYGIQGYPTIKFFPAGIKSGDALEYDGGRSASDIVRWANTKVVESLPPPEVKEILDQTTLKTACDDHQLCVIAVLPNILDCQAECRNKYLDIMHKTGEKYKSSNWGWLWTEAMKQPAIEKAFAIGGFGYPALVAVNVRKAKYATLLGPFSDTGVQEFVRDVSLGRGATAPIQGEGLPSINSVEPWDGLDGKPPVEEEIDLSELGIDAGKSEL